MIIVIDNAFKYESELQQLFLKVWYDNRYKYWMNSSYNQDFEMPKGEGDWRGRHFVSLDSSGNIVGYVGYEVCRTDDRCCGLGALSFVSGVNVTFAKDLITVVDDIFTKFNHRKLNFTCLTANPAYDMWNRYIQKAGGYELCVRKSHTKLEDGLFYDSAEFELFRDSYLQHRNQFMRRNLK